MTLSLNASHRILGLAIAALFAAAPALAEKPDWAGGGHGNKQEEKADKHAEKQAEKFEKKLDKQEHKAFKQARKQEREDIKVGTYFNDHQRQLARAYYVQQYGDGRRCPPGLARKNNGCMPPGQARKWAVGEPLPRGVVMYSVPQPVLVQLSPAPYGYRYARLGNDIVLVRTQNSLVVDIIQGLLG